MLAPHPLATANNYPSPGEVATPGAWGSPAGGGPSPVSGRRLLSVSFVSPKTGWVSMQTGALPGTISVFRTDDGGHRWQQQLSWQSDVASSALFDGPGSSTFFSDRLGYVVGPGWQGPSATLYRTSDGGSNWQRLQLPGRPGSSRWYLSFAGPSDIWMLANAGAAMGHEAGEIYHSPDSGTHWTRVTHFGLDDEMQGILYGGDKSGISFRNSAQGWLLGWVGTGQPLSLTSLRTVGPTGHRSRCPGYSAFLRGGRWTVPATPSTSRRICCRPDASPRPAWCQ